MSYKESRFKMNPIDLIEETIALEDWGKFRDEVQRLRF